MPTQSTSSKRRDAGIDTVVDLSPSEAGRDVRFAEEVSRKSGMQIVVCTGQRLFPPELRDRTTAELTELFIKEIEQGIDDTGIKAGVIKAATVSDGVTVFEERVLRAAARASKDTGVLIETHSHSLAPRRGRHAPALMCQLHGYFTKAREGHPLFE